MLLGVARLVDENRRFATLMHAVKKAWMMSSSLPSCGMSGISLSSSEVYSASRLRSKFMVVRFSFGISAELSTSMYEVRR